MFPVAKSPGACERRATSEQKLGLPAAHNAKFLDSVGGPGDGPLAGQCAFCQQALQFSFCFGAHAVDKSIRALAVLGAEHGQTHMQVGLVLFQAAQQPLSPGDSFFQCNHH